MVAAQILLDFKHGIHALRRHVALVRLIEEQRGVLPVVDYDVDLITAGPLRVDDEGTISLIPMRQMVLEYADPVLFGGFAASSWMCDGNAIAAKRALEPCLKPVKYVR